jgi:hypothetical protein
MVDYPPRCRQLNEDQEDYKDWISNPTDADIDAYEHWVAEQLWLTPARALTMSNIPALVNIHSRTSDLVGPLECPGIVTPRVSGWSGRKEKVGIGDDVD